MLAETLNKYKNTTILIKGHDNPDMDSVVSCILFKKILDSLSIKNEILIVGKIDYITRRTAKQLGIQTDRFIYTNDESLPIILLDHNEDNLPNTVICCIDHHPTEKTFNYLFYENRIIGSCSKLVLDHFKDFNIQATPDDIYKTIISMQIDTKLFKSLYKYNPEDKEWADKVTETLAFNKDEITELAECLNKDTDTLEDLAYCTPRNYITNNVKYSITCLQYRQFSQSVIDDIIDKIHDELPVSSNDFHVLMLTDMERAKSEVYFISFRVIFNKRYKEIISRGNVLVPYIKENFQSIIDRLKIKHSIGE